MTSIGVNKTHKTARKIGQKQTDKKPRVAAAQSRAFDFAAQVD